MKLLDLPLVRGTDLPSAHREALRPGEELVDAHGRAHRLPRAFLCVDSWETALNTPVTEHFTLWEFMGVDVREAEPQRTFPRYVPCAIVILAQALELFRREAGTYTHIAANGAYRSPGHALTRDASRHCWGTAVNIYRIGDTWLESRDDIERYASLAQRTIPGVWVRPYGSAAGQADDHLHLDLGYTTFEPVLD